MENMVQEQPKKRATARPKSTLATAKRAKVAAPKPAAPRKAGRNPKATMAAPHIPGHDEIARRAHVLYVESGYAPGRDQEFWLEAERQLLAELNA